MKGARESRVLFLVLFEKVAGAARRWRVCAAKRSARSEGRPAANDDGGAVLMVNTELDNPVNISLKTGDSKKGRQLELRILCLDP